MSRIGVFLAVCLVSASGGTPVLADLLDRPVENDASWLLRSRPTMAWGAVLGGVQARFADDAHAATDWGTGWLVGLALEERGGRPFFWGASLTYESRSSAGRYGGTEGVKYEDTHRFDYLMLTGPSIGLRAPRGAWRPYVRVSPAISMLLHGESLQRELHGESEAVSRGTVGVNPANVELAGVGAVGVLTDLGRVATTVELRYLQALHHVGSSGVSGTFYSEPGELHSNVVALVASVGPRAKTHMEAR